MTEPTTTHGMTVAELRQMIAKHAQADEDLFNRVFDQARALPAERVGELGEQFRAAHHGMLYGYAVVALLRWLGEKYGPDAALEAASIVQDLGENGGNEWLDDIEPAEAVDRG